MEYMLLIMNYRGRPPREPIGLPEMGKFAAEMTQSGKLRSGAPLLPDAQGARVRVVGRKADTVDGPFAESKEIVGGYMQFGAANRAEAIEIAKRCPMARAEFVEVFEANVERVPSTWTDGKRFLLIFIETAALDDPDGSKHGAMDRWIDGLKAEKKYVECAGLVKPTGARIEIVGGKAAVVDGPFAESKEVAGGIALIAAKDRAEAVEIAKRCPHATWGTVEVREVMKVGPM
jgi:hypothetical protein